MLMVSSDPSICSRTQTSVACACLRMLLSASLAGEEDVVTHFRREEVIGQFRWYFEMALDSSVCEMLARKLANVTGQVLQRVVLRVDGPHDFIHFAHHLTRRRGEFPCLRADRLTFVFNAIGPQVVLQ